ncbi:MAG: PEGA domain-containing protein [Kofleriaceae bacterium]
MTKIGTWVMTGAMLLGTVGTAAAAPKPKPTPEVVAPPVEEPPPPETPWGANVPQAEKAQAIALATRGDEFFTTNEYGEAVKLYDEALTHWNHPAIHFNKTVCLMRLGRFLEADVHLKAALEYDGKALSDNDLRNAETFKEQLARLLVKVSITTTQDGVEVTLDGERLISGTGVGEKTVTPGSHALVATKPGFETLTQNLSLNPGEPYAETLVLKPAPKPATKLVRRWEKTWVPWTIAGAGAGVGLLGAGLMVIARSHMDQFNSTISSKCSSGCSQPDLPGGEGPDDPDLVAAYDRKDQANLENTLGIGMVGVGGAAVLTGLVMVALNQPKEVPAQGPTGPQVVFTGSDTNLGVSVMGRF